MSGAGAPSDEQKRAFHDRLNRVTGVTPEPEDAGTRDPSRPGRPKKKAPPTMRENLRYPLSFVWAFLICGLSVVVGAGKGATGPQVRGGDGGVARVELYVVGGIRRGDRV
jgi:hypothetical protein